MSATLLTNTVDFLVDEPSLVIGVLGFSFTIWQLLRTRKAAIAAKEAAQKTQSSLQKNFMLVDISTCIGMIEVIQTSIRTGQYDAALFRIKDLIAQLIQIRKLPVFSTQEIKGKRGVVTQLSFLRNTLEARDSDTKKTLEVAKINKKLSEISDCLNGWIGVYKYSINKED